VAKADHLEAHGRIVSGSAGANPVVELILSLAKGSAPELAAQTAAPVSAEIRATLRGLSDLAGKPWSQRLREIQAANGGLDVTRARVEQGAVVSAANGTLRLSPAGRLDGELGVTVVNIEQAIVALGLERMPAATADQTSAATRFSGRLSQYGPALGSLDKSFPGLGSTLDRLAPGLGGVVRGQPEQGIVALIKALGTAAELEGKPAVALPLRLRDGMASIGPIPLGRIPPLL
ncbi:MAG: DUF2125 domain-containing protein, partial [Proteobacteria bacterium]|nr:DUF2125 domain-containing protein [Pseudomonadota bacterium]